MRRAVLATAIVFAALGLTWLVRLGRAAPSRPRSERPAEPSRVAHEEPPPVRANAPRLGRVGGTLPSTLVDPRLLVEKARRTLTVFSEERPAKTYRIALGSASGGDKVREGDGRTPEGVFYLCSKNEQSAYHLSLGLSYPNVEDAERGRRDGLINPREYRAITDALKHYRRPPWNTRLGGEIMIHGGGTASDWTTGCIAVDDADIDELFGILPLGTEVEIRP